VFVHLRCHSHYSFLRGVAPPEEIIAAAVEQKMPAVALTDTNGLYAAVPFYQEALKAGVKPIVGATLDVQWAHDRREIPRSTQNDRSRSGNDGDGKSANSVAMVLLAADMDGYSNLCQLVTLRHLGTTELTQSENSREDDGGPVADEERPVTMEELAEHSKGVIALCPLPTRMHIAGDRRATARRARSVNGAPREADATYRMGMVHKTGTACRAPTETEQCSDFALLKGIFGDRLWIEVQYLSPGDGRKLREAERIGRALGVPLVATNNVHFLKPPEHLHHRAVNAVRTGGLLTTVAPPEITTGEAWFKPASVIQRLFPDHPELLQASLDIAGRCDLKLELGKLILPEFEVPKNDTPDSYLAKLSLQGLFKRYGWLKPEANSRLAHELRVISKWKLAPYFLLVRDIVKEAKRRGIPAVARGSAASSMVTYCLEISCVCPLRWGLYFERFLNEQRGDCPDIDIDICGARRDELLDYVYEHWGAEHVAMIGSFITMHARLGCVKWQKCLACLQPK
jgi:DNA polymerase-3 subunit alpha